MTKEINIANTHLEPWLGNRELGMGQLELEHKLLKSLEMPSMLVGDFNLHSPESDSIDGSYFMELWEELKDPSDENYTWLGPPDGDPIYSKLDFTLLTKDGTYKPIFISRCGNYSLPSYAHESHHLVNEDTILRSPSDHLGLYMVIQ